MLRFILILLCLPAAAVASPDTGRFAIIFSEIKYDGGFNDHAAAAIDGLRRAHGIPVQENVARDPASAEAALRRFAGDGVGNILVLGANYADMLARVAADHPDIRFTIVDAEVSAPNVRAIVFREDEAGFLVGAAAGYATRSGVVAFIGATSDPPVLRFYCGFKQGVAAAQPGVAVIRRFMGEDANMYRDRSRARRTAENALAGGADILFPAAGMAGQAAIEAAAERGALAIGVDSNQNATAPGHVLTSAVKRIDTAVRESWTRALHGDWRAGVIRLGLAEGAVDWAIDRHNIRLVTPFRENVDRLKREIAAGERQVTPLADRPDCRPTL